MAIFKRFSSNGYSGVIEKRDCLFDPYAEKRSSFLRREDLIAPRFKFSDRKLTDEEISELVKKLFCK